MLKIFYLFSLWIKHVGLAKLGSRLVTQYRAGWLIYSSLLDIEVVVWAEHVAGNDGGEHAAVLLVVCLVLHVYHSLGVGVSKVRGVGGSVVDHRLVYWICRLVREYAGAETRDNLGHSKLVAGSKNVVIHLHVVSVEITVSAHISKKSPHQSREMDDVSGLVLLKQGKRLALTERKEMSQEVSSSVQCLT